MWFAINNNEYIISFIGIAVHKKKEKNIVRISLDAKNEIDISNDTIELPHALQY